MDKFFKIYEGLRNINDLVSTAKELNVNFKIHCKEDHPETEQKYLDEIDRDIKILQSCYDRIQSNLNKGKFKRFRDEKQYMKERFYDILSKFDAICTKSVEKKNNTK